MNKLYSRIVWENFPSEKTALNERNLNRMDLALDNLDDRVIQMDSTKVNIEIANNLVKTWSIDEETGIITVQHLDGSKDLFDLNIEKIPVDFKLSDDGILTMTTDDGSKYTANIGAMIPVLTFEDSDTISVSVSGTGVNKTYSFSIKAGSVTEDKLQPNFLADVKTEVAKAQASQTAAAESAAAASGSATEAESYAHGGTGSRTGEETDNAKYYYEKAKNTEIGKVSEEVAGLSNDLGVLSARLDNIASLPEGSTTADAELMDIRVGSDGRIYNTAGEAVREQVGELKGDLVDLRGTTRNIWDEEYVYGSIDVQGIVHEYGGNIISKNYNNILPSKKYYRTTEKCTVVFYDNDKNYISQDGTGTPIFLTPSNAKYFLIKLWSTYGSQYNNDVCISLATEKREYVPHTSAKDISARENIETLNNNTIKMNYLHVSNDYNSNTVGWWIDKFKSIKDANDAIGGAVLPQATYNNRYTIIVKNGTYTDLQTLYSGQVGGYYQGVVCKDYVYYESENINRPDLTIIEWDGATGISNPSYNDVFLKCPFHIVGRTTGIHTHIKGFTFKCKNLRYCMHIETEGLGVNVDWLIENCVFDWGGCPNTPSTNVPTVGMGSSQFEVGKIKNCTFKNSSGASLGIQNHTNEWSEYHMYTPFMHVGANITIENCNLNGLDIQFRTGSNDYDSFNILNIVGCKNVNRTYFSNLSNYSGDNMWKSNIECSQITQNDM